MPITIYGIKNCDTMKKAFGWLDKHRVAYEFHDYKSAGIEREQLERWSKKVGWETLLNRSGLTFKKLPDKDKQDLTEKKAITLMLDKPSMIKRPVLDLGGGKLVVGFKPELYDEMCRRLHEEKAGESQAELQFPFPKARAVKLAPRTAPESSSENESDGNLARLMY